MTTSAHQAKSPSSWWLGLRTELLVILLYAIVLTIMTYPLVFKLSEIIPMHNPDTYTAMWQNWWLQQILVDGADPNFTSLLFYPNGLDVTLIPQRWTSYPLWTMFYALFGEPLAYNLTTIIQMLIRAYAMYRLILLFVPHRPSAWIGGAFFAFTPRILVAALQQPNTGAVEFIPIFMIFFVLAIRRIIQEDKNIKSLLFLMLLAGLAFCANVYMNLKIGVFAMLLGGGYAIWMFLIHRLWKQPSFWLGMGVFVLVSSVISAPILIPTLTYEGLSEAINQYIPDRGLDLLHYLKADLQYPFFYNQLIASRDDVLLSQVVPAAFAQIGFVSIILALVGTRVIIQKRRDQLIWLVMVFIFFWLSLGVTIYIDRKPIEWLPTLYPLIIDNPIIIALREPFRFQILMIFAMSILMAYGLQAVFQRFSSPMARIVISLVVVFMFFEISSFPIPYREAALSPAYDYVSERHTGPLIVMPMGRQSAKYTMYTQMSHHLPIPEGMIARMPDGVYQFIDEDNLFLRDVSDIDNNTRVTDELLANWSTEIDELLALDFRYVLVHRLEYAGRILVVYPYQERMFFMEIEPDFETDNAAVYDLQKLRDNPPQGDPFAED